MIALQSIGVLLCLLLLVGFGLAIRPAIRADRRDYHLFHGPDSGCPDCQAK